VINPKREMKGFAALLGSAFYLVSLLPPSVSSGQRPPVQKIVFVPFRLGGAFLLRPAAAHARQHKAQVVERASLARPW
jgi:hypothetical protein